MPYRSQSNSLQERFIQEVVRGVRALLRASGLPEHYWPFALVAFMHAYNVQIQDNLFGGVSPMIVRHPNHDPLLTRLAPFGSRVDFRDYPHTETKFTKGRSGVILGYYAHDDGVLDGSWMIVDELELLQSIVHHLPVPKVVRTRDYKAPDIPIFPVAHAVEQYKALYSSRIDRVPTRILHAFSLFDNDAVSYTHLTLPTNREV